MYYVKYLHGLHGNNNDLDSTTYVEYMYGNIIL